jgi:hypothetical protein
MPHDIKAGSPEDWLRHAKADLALAASPLPRDGLYSTLCFHAQQAAEKSIKAILVFRGIEFPKVHILTRLIDLLPSDIIRTVDLLESARLAVYSFSGSLAGGGFYGWGPKSKIQLASARYDSGSNSYGKK